MSRLRRTARACPERLFARIEGVQEKIKELAGHGRVHSVVIWLWSAGGPFGLDLTPKLSEKIERLGASLKIDVYDAEEPWSPGDPRWLN
jgi:hypothetical protein